MAIAKSAQRHNMAADIPAIKTPTLLIWGLNDTITPPMVAHEFNQVVAQLSVKIYRQVLSCTNDGASR